MRSNTERKTNDPPIDYQTEMKMFSYTISLRESEIIELKKVNKELAEKYLQIDKELCDLKASYYHSFKTEKTIRQLQDMLEVSKEENSKLKEEIKNNLKKFESERDELIIHNEMEVSKMKQLVDSYGKKIESVNTIQEMFDKKEQEVKSLEQEKEKIKIESEEMIKQKEIYSQIKFTEIKRKMLLNIAETQKNVNHLNIEYMDVSTKLTMLQNHQLLIEIEYLSNQLEDLIKKKETLEKKVFELSKDLEIHKQVEIALAQKNKKYSDKIKELEKKTIDASEINESKNTFNLKDFSLVSGLERKTMKLENEIKRKQEDYEKMKKNFDYLDDKLKKYEKRYSNIFSLFEEAIRKLAEDEEVRDNSELFINLESIKNGDFSDLSNQEKYSILVILMKHLAPLVNFDLLTNNYDDIRINLHGSKKYLQDPILKKVFSGKNNVLYSIQKHSYDSLPPLKKLGSGKLTKSMHHYESSI